jgi:hypothetical protein
LANPPSIVKKILSKLSLPINNLGAFHFG